jgi:CspA family cold shock protein
MSNTGTIKWFNPTKGYGFITPDNSGSDIFFHKSALEASHIDPNNVQDGQKVSYDLESGNNGKTSAININLL